MPDSESPNRVTVHTTSGQELTVQNVVRHFEKDWMYATRHVATDDEPRPPNQLAIRNENIVAIDAPFIKRTGNPQIRIHHSGDASEFDYEEAISVFDIDTEE